MSRLRLFGDLKPAGALDEWATPSQGAPPVGFPAIRPTRNGSPSISLPASGGVAIPVPAGTAWSDWVLLTAGESADHVLATLNCLCLHKQNRPSFIQLGVGADPGSAITAEFYNYTSGPLTEAVCFPAQLAIDGRPLPADTALSARVRSQTNATADMNALSLAATAMPVPLTFAPDWNEEAYRQGVSQVKRAPDIPSTVAITTGAVDDWGNWAQVLASAPCHLLIQGIEVTVSGSPPPPFTAVVLQVGLGAQGFETPQETVPFPTPLSTLGGAGYYPLPRPVEVLQGERIALRARAGKANQSVSAALLLHYLSF